MFQFCKMTHFSLCKSKVDLDVGSIVSTPHLSLNGRKEQTSMGLIYDLQNLTNLGFVFAVSGCFGFDLYLSHHVHRFPPPPKIYKVKAEGTI